MQTSVHKKVVFCNFFFTINHFVAKLAETPPFFNFLVIRGTTNMEYNILKRLFEQGLLATAFVVPAPLSKHWHLCFTTAAGKTERMTLARQDTLKEYKTVNGALSDALKVGFKEVTIKYDTAAAA